MGEPDHAKDFPSCKFELFSITPPPPRPTSPLSYLSPTGCTVPNLTTTSFLRQERGCGESASACSTRGSVDRWGAVLGISSSALQWWVPEYQLSPLAPQRTIPETENGLRPLSLSPPRHCSQIPEDDVSSDLETVRAMVLLTAVSVIIGLLALLGTCCDIVRTKVCMTIVLLMSMVGGASHSISMSCLPYHPGPRESCPP